MSKERRELGVHPLNRHKRERVMQVAGRRCPLPRTDRVVRDPHGDARENGARAQAHGADEAEAEEGIVVGVLPVGACLGQDAPGDERRPRDHQHDLQSGCTGCVSARLVCTRWCGLARCE